MPDGRIRHEDAYPIDDIVALENLPFRHVLIVSGPLGCYGHCRLLPLRASLPSRGNATGSVRLQIDLAAGFTELAGLLLQPGSEGFRLDQPVLGRVVADVLGDLHAA